MPHKHQKSHPLSRAPVKLSPYGKKRLTILRPGLFKTRSSAFEFGKDVFDLYLQNDPKDLGKFWDRELTKSQLKNRRLRLIQIFGHFLFFLKWRKDPNPRFTYFVQNLDDGIEAREIIRRDREWAQANGEA
ncbi:hypothetical protein VKT23_010257 [Stygiomarasmius scandens]|uniref:Uncharacterized protein n=1 Tax=Marasmiellus scandens TaxID=2682957 RepID=A0ABR1JCG4_9AGAR